MNEKEKVDYIELVKSLAAQVSILKAQEEFSRNYFREFLEKHHPKLKLDFESRYLAHVKASSLKALVDLPEIESALLRLLKTQLGLS